MSISLGQMDDAFVEAGKQLNMSDSMTDACIDDIYEFWYDGKPQLEEPESTKLIKQVYRCLSRERIRATFNVEIVSIFLRALT